MVMDFYAWPRGSDTLAGDALEAPSAPKMTPVPPTMSQESSHTVLRMPRKTQEGVNTSQERPKMANERLQILKKNRDSPTRDSRSPPIWPQRNPP